MDYYNGTAVLRIWRQNSTFKDVVRAVRITPKRVTSATRTWDRSGNQISGAILMRRVALISYRSNDGKIAWDCGEAQNEL